MLWVENIHRHIHRYIYTSTRIDMSYYTHVSFCTFPCTLEELFQSLTIISLSSPFYVHLFNIFLFYLVISSRYTGIKTSINLKCLYTNTFLFILSFWSGIEVPINTFNFLYFVRLRVVSRSTSVSKVEINRELIFFGGLTQKTSVRRMDFWRREREWGKLLKT